MIGRTLSHFEITAKLGAGGMGEVYRAQDTKLGREVAIKVLPEEFSQHPERLARFKREAQVLASLNHPHIAAIYEVGEARLDASRPSHFIAMELAEGDTLADRIRKGAVPVPEALEIATQIAKALEAAHEKEIIHRDLKPANVKVSPDGTVKVLDFGLAKAGTSRSEDPEFTHSPTLTAPMALLGTAAYMSPEQAKGQGADQRSDIWGLGAVLWEMLAGERLFRRATVTETIAAILERKPDFGDLPPETPPIVLTLLKRCLEKEPRQRMHHAADVRIALEEAAKMPRGMSAAASEPDPRGKAAWFLGGAAIALLAAMVGWFSLRPSEKALPAERFELLPPAGVGVDIMGSDDRLAISPDGTRVVFRGQPTEGPARLFLRSTRELSANVLVGTENASNPFFSPNGKWLGFWVDGSLKKLHLDGGEPIPICSVEAIRGASWGADDTIVLGSFEGGLLRVPADGGTPAPLTSLDPERGERDHRWPQFLPGGEAILYSSRSVLDEEVYSVDLVDLGSGDQQTLKSGGTKPMYGNGNLYYSYQGTVYSVGFDPTTVTLQGTPQPVLQDVSFTDGSGNAHLALSTAGALVWVPGAWRPPETELIAVAPGGEIDVLIEQGRSFESPRPSPDGRFMAVTMLAGVNEADVWTYEMDRELWQRLTSQRGYDPVWAPDGASVAFSSDRNGPFQMFLRPTDGSGSSEPLTQTTQWEFPGSFSPDGRFLVFQRIVGASQWDIFSMDLAGGRAETALLDSRAMEIHPVLSPDGSLLAYSSDQTGRIEVYVQSFPEPGPRVQVSTGGGSNPVWHPDGRQLLYLEVSSTFGAGRKILAAEITGGSRLSAGRPRNYASVDFDIMTRYTWHAFDVLPGSDRVVLARPVAGTEQEPRLVYAPNWVHEPSDQ